MKAICGLLLVVGLVLTILVSPWWFLLIAVGGGILLQSVLFRPGWLAELFAHCGVRHGYQLDEERMALRVLRGDLKCLPTIAEIVDRQSIDRMQDEGGPALHDDDNKYDLHEAAQAIATAAKV